MNSLANPSLVAYLPLRREGKPPYRDREVRAIAGLFCYLKKSSEKPLQVLWMIEISGLFQKSLKGFNGFTEGFSIY
jgi:hypothetical protein